MSSANSQPMGESMEVEEIRRDLHHSCFECWIELIVKMMDTGTILIFFPLLDMWEDFFSGQRNLKTPKHSSLASLTFAIFKSKLALCLASQEHIILAKLDLPQAMLPLFVKTSISMFLPLVFNELMSLTMERTDICHQDLWHPQTLTMKIHLDGFDIWLTSSLWLLVIITTKTFFYFLYWELFAFTDMKKTHTQLWTHTKHYVVEKQLF